jgi:hypothetical protein
MVVSEHRVRLAMWELWEFLSSLQKLLALHGTCDEPTHNPPNSIGSKAAGDGSSLIDSPYGKSKNPRFRFYSRNEIKPPSLHWCCLVNNIHMYRIFLAEFEVFATSAGNS